ncbi:RNA polymerase subunit ABC14.5 [Nadsonia fulvescens var. elongata DSM 6958]|uniref:DNA-directed RNA polymerases I, II, and III subunit RPABC3 n=1 Tax=Nadsonia fulvescens var. elongata DSM 6958 TaxID=857566 RepID=A0A1E3PNK5_9ASCO|nr:RNA polymerase subunit ABC14.5 [Nadsonia fulvescens var. elongata DSM 6958]
MSAQLFDDHFKITSVDSARYDRVSRITANSVSSNDIQLTLDVNSELFPVAKNDSVTVVVAKSLSLGQDDDGNGSSTSGSWRETRAGEKSLADDYDYVTYGTVYKFEESGNDKVSVYVSFGGLLMCLEGNYRKLSNLKQENVYLLIRR